MHHLAEPRTHIIGGRTGYAAPSPAVYLAKRLGPVEFIANKAAKYLESVKDTMPRLNWNLYNDAIKNVSRASALAAEILEIVGGLAKHGPATITQYLSSASSLFDKLDELELCLNHLIALFSGSVYEELAIYGKSTTAAAAMTDEKNAITSWHRKYTSFDDMTLLETLLSGANISGTNNTLAFEFVIAAKSINKFTIGVIGTLMRGASGAMLNRLKSMIEAQKDTILDAAREDISDLTGIHGMIVRYSLTPTTASQSLPELFAAMKLLYVTDESPSDNFARIAVGPLGIIVIHKESKSPIEYNLRGLLDEQYILREGLNNAPMAGLNKKTIRKYNTAVMLPMGNSPGRIQEQDTGGTVAVPRAGVRETYNVDRATHVYVFETITSGYYRTLGFAGETKMPIARVNGLLHGLTSRPHQYNLRQFEVIREVCFDDRAEYVLTQYENEKNVPASSGPIRTAISDRMIDVFRESLRVLPKSPSAFRKYLPRHDVINEIIVDVLAAAAGIGANRPAEFVVTCIARFNSIVHRFTKDIERRWASRELPARVFDDYEGDTLRHELIALFRETLTATIEELDKSHAWTEYDISIKEFVLGIAT
jgi:hypothetical protein